MPFFLVCNWSFMTKSFCVECGELDAQLSLTLLRFFTYYSDNISHLQTCGELISKWDWSQIKKDRYFQFSYEKCTYCEKRQGRVTTSLEKWTLKALSWTEWKIKFVGRRRIEGSRDSSGAQYMVSWFSFVPTIFLLLLKLLKELGINIS